MIKIDGSKLEGGGQILRMASSLGCIMNVPISVNNIRAGRPKGGLKSQHLFGLKLIQDISKGQLNGGFLDSMEIDFSPGKITGGSLYADVQTAGSLSLLIQSILPCALFASHPSSIVLKGGTNVDMAPQIDYTIQVFQALCNKFGIDSNFNVNLKKRGYFPRGGGEIELHVKPISGHINPVTMLDPGDVTSVNGVSVVAGALPVRMAHDMADVVQKSLKKVLDPKIPISIERRKETPTTSTGNGSFIVLWAKTSTGCIFGGSALGKRGLRSEEVGAKAAEELIQAFKSGSCVDSYSQDQMIILMALANGKSRIRTGEITMHTKTAIYIAELLTKAKFSIIEDSETDTVVLECDGIGSIPLK